MFYSKMNTKFCTILNMRFMLCLCETLENEAAILYLLSTLSSAEDADRPSSSTPQRHKSIM